MNYRIAIALIALALAFLMIGCADNKQNERIDRLEGDVDAINGRIAAIQDQIEMNIAYMQILHEADQLSASQAQTLQATVNAQQATLLVLQGYENVKEYVDPCGNGPSFDEVLMRTSSGKLVAHFSSGALEFFTLLTPGSYVTTDSQACQFTVTNDGKVCDVGGCK